MIQYVGFNISKINPRYLTAIFSSIVFCFQVKLSNFFIPLIIIVCVFPFLILSQSVQLLYFSEPPPPPKAISAKDLTCDWDEYDDEVEYVPGIEEVLLPQSHYLHNTLKGVDGGEHDIETEQRIVPDVTHLVVVHGHSDHVRQNHYGYRYLKLGRGRNVKEER